MQWSPNVDTLLPGREFCCSAKLVRKRSDGVEIWKCPGHEMIKSELNIADDLPHALRSGPLRGKRLVEVFSGDPSSGGAQLSSVWEESGGTSVRYDLLSQHP